MVQVVDQVLQLFEGQAAPATMIILGRIVIAEFAVTSFLMR